MNEGFGVRLYVSKYLWAKLATETSFDRIKFLSSKKA